MSRETRLLLATIAVSIGVLVALAQFRFPEEAARATADAVAAPLERLAARATYDELAAIMADLERRLTPRLTVVRIEPARPTGEYAVAARLTPDRAAVLLGLHESVVQAESSSRPVLARDPNRDVAVLSVPQAADAVVSMPIGAPRRGPRYVAVVEGTPQGPVLRPIYVGRTDVVQDPRTNTPLLSITGLQQFVPRGAAVFSLTGNFMGFALQGGTTVTIVPADILKAVAESLQPLTETRGDFAIDVQALTGPLAKASGAAGGVIVTYVNPQGPAAGQIQPGDVIAAVDGTSVTTPEQFQQLVRSRPPGSTAALRMVRRGRPIEAAVVVRDLTGPPLAAPPPDPRGGMVIRTIPGTGVEVVGVQAGLQAERAGLLPGDIIIRVNDRDAPTEDALLAAYRQATPETPLLLTVRRGRQHHVLALERE